MVKGQYGGELKQNKLFVRKKLSPAGEYKDNKSAGVKNKEGAIKETQEKDKENGKMSEKEGRPATDSNTKRLELVSVRV